MGKFVDMFSAEDFAKVSATPDDNKAVQKAIQVGTFLENTEKLSPDAFKEKYGITPDEWVVSFGTMTPKDAIELFTLTGKPVPTNPKQWKAFVKICKKTHKSVFGRN